MTFALQATLPAATLAPHADVHLGSAFETEVSIECYD